MEDPLKDQRMIDLSYKPKGAEETGEVGICPDCGRTVKVLILPQDRAIGRIAAAVARRGYRQGWTTSQFLARQAAKMQEELGETASELLYLIPDDLQTAIQEAADLAKRYFDHEPWRDGYIATDCLDLLWWELVDQQVVLANLASAVCELLGEQRDLLKYAVEKAEADVKRGVRHG